MLLCAFFDIYFAVSSPASARSCGNLFFFFCFFRSSRQLALGTWKSSCQETDWGRRCGMVTLPGCRRVCLAKKKKDHVLELPRSQGNRYPQPHSETKWLPGSPTSLFLAIRQIIRYFFFPQCECELTHRMRRCICSVHKYMCAHARVCFRLGVSCGAVNLRQPHPLLSYPPIACVLYIWQTL